MPRLQRTRHAGRIADSIHALTRELEATHERGGDVVVVPAVRSLLGALPARSFIVSRGPWMAQRALLAALVFGAPAGRTRGGVDTPVDGESSEDVDGDILPVALTIDGLARLELVRHAVASRAGIAVDELRLGQIPAGGWPRLAEAMGELQGASVAVYDGVPGEADVVWGDDLLGWRLLFSDVPAAEAGHADVLIDASIDEQGVHLRVLDGRVEPPVVRKALVIDGVIRDVIAWKLVDNVGRGADGQTAHGREAPAPAPVGDDDEAGPRAHPPEVGDDDDDPWHC